MRDPLSWSFPIGRLSGITIRIHVLFPVVAIPLVIRAASVEGAPAGTWLDATQVMFLLFLSVLLHEFGHCYGARRVDGDAHEVLLWPLGGLAMTEVPHTPWALFVTTVMGPVVNLLLCALCLVLLATTGDPAVQPIWNPFHSWIIRNAPDGAMVLTQWNGERALVTNLGTLILVRLFWVNWVLLLINIVLVGFPLDGGRLLQSILWPRFGYRQATLAAVFAGFVVFLILCVVGLAANEVMAFALAIFIFVECRRQWIILETGGEESVFGYDFSQGYTSLERDQPPAPAPRKRRPSFWQRWRQARAARKLQREIETREAEERRMDELLEKIQREGKQALTDEEQRFLKRVADKYRNRQ